MIDYRVMKAGKIGEQGVESVTIIIDQEMPEKPYSVDWQKECIKTYGEQGAYLAEILCHALPGGTLDQLIMNLLQRRASLFRIPLFVVDDEFDGRETTEP